MLEDPKSTLVKRVARLSEKDARSETGLFLLEGPQGLKELTRNPELAVDVFATAQALDRYESEFRRLVEAGVKVTEVSQVVLEKLADTKTPQGVVSVLGQLDVELDELLAISPRLVAVLDQARDPGNAGSVVRVADATGADAVILTDESVDLYNPKLVRSTAGSILNIPTVKDQELASVLDSLKAAGLQIFVTAVSGKPLPELGTELLAAPTAWVFGNEAHGVSQLALERADQIVALPIYGLAESLNLATASAVCLYASAFAQRASH